jgi:hypothetical protein
MLRDENHRGVDPAHNSVVTQPVLWTSKTGAICPLNRWPSRVSGYIVNDCEPRV